jgi:hypothetical protein
MHGPDPEHLAAARPSRERSAPPLRRLLRAALQTVIALALRPSAAVAAPTGLNQIPTTDVVPAGQLSLQLQNGNTEISGSDSVFHQPQLLYQSEFGFTLSSSPLLVFEGGLDVAPSNPPDAYRPIANLKWSPLREDYWIPAGAIGISQLGVGFSPNYFLVLTKTLNYSAIQYQKFRAHHRNRKLRGIRLHTGVQYTSHAWQALVGTDVEVSDYFVIYSDWISGSSNSVSLGGVLVVNQHLSFQAALLRRNDEDRLSGIIMQVTYTFDLLHPFE